MAIQRLVPTESGSRGHAVDDFCNFKDFDDFDDFALPEVSLLFELVSLSVAARQEQEGTDAEMALTTVLGWTHPELSSYGLFFFELLTWPWCFH